LNISKIAECGCCGPEDPMSEHQTQIETRAGTPYPNAAPESDAGTNGYDGDRVRSQHAGQQQTPQNAAVRFSQEGDLHAPLMPPPPPSSEQVDSAPRGTPVSYTPAAAPDQQPAENNRGNATSLSLEEILADLNGAENTAYGAAFEAFCGTQAALQPDDAQLRDFIITHSSVTVGEVDIELLKIASLNDNLSVDKAGFLQILRDNSINEGDALQEFMALAADGENVPAEDCRTGLLNMIQQKLNTNFSDTRSEKIFDSVMVDAELTVPMEQWIAYCKKVGRIVRLARYAQI